MKACQDLPGQDLFQYLDENGERQIVTSADVNAYLKEITGRDITAKDFRTWAGTVLAALALSEFESFDSEAKAKKNIRAAIEQVSSRLGNTPTICRKCYVHPEVFTCYLEGALLLEIKEEVEAELRENLAGLRPEEAAVLTLLEAAPQPRDASVDKPAERSAAGDARRRKPREGLARGACLSGRNICARRALARALTIARGHVMRIHHLNCGCMCPVGGRLWDGVEPRPDRRSSSATACWSRPTSGLVLVDTGFGTRGRGAALRAPEPALHPRQPHPVRPPLHRAGAGATAAASRRATCATSC